MIKRLLHRAGLAGLLAFATLLAACGGGGDGTSTANGQLRIRLTDSQSCNYESVFVTVTEVRVSQSSTASDSDSGWETLTLSPARQVDLMTLRNGVFEELGTLPLPAGTYQQVRLVLAVKCQQVLSGNREARDRRFEVDAVMRPVPVVEVVPCWQCVAALV